MRAISPRERLVHHVQELERCEALKKRATDNLKDAFEAAAAHGFDSATLKVVLKLRKMTPEQRRERRALEAIYMAALGMLEGDALPESARQRFDEARGTRGTTAPPSPSTPAPGAPDGTAGATPEPPSPSVPEQPTLALKDPEEARQEGTEAALAGKRIYDNPYQAGDPCRAAWDEGWCAQQKSHGMDTPAVYQRRTAKKDDRDKDGGAGDDQKGAE